jgi:hypothetical protein
MFGRELRPIPESGYRIGGLSKKAARPPRRDLKPETRPLSRTWSGIASNEESSDRLSRTSPRRAASIGADGTTTDVHVCALRANCASIIDVGHGTVGTNGARSADATSGGTGANRSRGSGPAARGGHMI